VTGRDVISRIWALSSQVRSDHYVREDRIDQRTTFLPVAHTPRLRELTPYR
jgi:hypothetical protein